MLRRLSGSMCFLALFNSSIPSSFELPHLLIASPSRWHYVTRKYYPGASCLPLSSTSSEWSLKTSLHLGITLPSSCSCGFSKPSVRVITFQLGGSVGEQSQKEIAKLYVTFIFILVALFQNPLPPCAS